jgi:hypothetical protein
MSSSHLDRRVFLKGAGAFAAVPLIGTALAAEPYQPMQAPALKGSAKSVVIPTHEWAGDFRAPARPARRPLLTNALSF